MLSVVYRDTMNNFTTIELFAGAGGMALGMEKAGFHHLLLNDFDKSACQTLQHNRPNWNVITGDVKAISFKEYLGKVDLVTGGFPCQAFSYSGKRLGFEDTRGTLFYEFARCIKETQPKCFMAENVKGLLKHENGKTLEVIINTFKDLGYKVYEPTVINSNNYDVAQKRERIIIFGVRKDLEEKIPWEMPPIANSPVLKDIFYSGNYFSSDVSSIKSIGSEYSSYKKQLYSYIGQGENWRKLPVVLQEKYMGAMFHSGGGKTGVLARLSMNKPGLTILTSPSQKQTERCHPLEDRPLNVRESARVQSFPDNWEFKGSISNQYKQIGNAVPVEMAYHLGKKIKELLEKL